MAGDKKRGPMWAAILVLFVAVALMSKLTSSQPADRGAPDLTDIGSTMPTASQVAAQPLTGARLTGRESDTYRADPSSMGYGDEDRAFLSEHGVTEAEARAAETVAERYGVK